MVQLCTVILSVSMHDPFTVVFKLLEFGIFLHILPNQWTSIYLFTIFIFIYVFIINITPAHLPWFAKLAEALAGLCVQL